MFSLKLKKAMANVKCQQKMSFSWLKDPPAARQGFMGVRVKSAVGERGSSILSPDTGVNCWTATLDDPGMGVFSTTIGVLSMVSDGDLGSRDRSLLLVGRTGVNLSDEFSSSTSGKFSRRDCRAPMFYTIAPFILFFLQNQFWTGPVSTL